MARAIRVTAPADTVVEVPGAKGGRLKEGRYTPNSFVPAGTEEINVTWWVDPTEAEQAKADAPLLAQLAAGEITQEEFDARDQLGRFAVRIVGVPVNATAAEIQSLLDAERQAMLDDLDYEYGT